MTADAPTPALLTPVEARVLAVLVEKRHTVPDTYPMSLNALLAGCNQKTSRDPVMDLGETEVRGAIEALRDVIERIVPSSAKSASKEKAAKKKKAAAEPETE